MKRRILLFLLLGAIVNITVAWAMDIAQQSTRAQGLVGGIPLVGQALLPPPGISLLPHRVPGWYQSGWPCWALQRRELSHFHAAEWVIWRDGCLLTLPKNSIFNRNQLRLPVLPTQTGFAINTIFYAATLWVLFAAPGTIRRWQRIRRGLCPACAYDLRASASQTCPECGASIPAASRAAE